MSLHALLKTALFRVILHIIIPYAGTVALAPLLMEKLSQSSGVNSGRISILLPPST